MHVTCVMPRLTHIGSPKFGILERHSSAGNFLNILQPIGTDTKQSQPTRSLLPNLSTQTKHKTMTDVVRSATQTPLFSHVSSIEEFDLKPHAPRPTTSTDVLTDISSASLQDSDHPLPDRKHRKSVAFSGDNTMMDENGDISEAPQSGAEDKTTAEKHSSPSADAGVDEVTDMFAGLNKKKKKASKPKADDKEDGEAPAADGEFDASILKKKKKKSTKPKAEGAEDFAAKLAQAGLADDGADGEDKENQPSATQDEDGDMEAGTGIWAHEATGPITYALLLKRFFETVNSKNPDILMSGSKSYKIPPPQCLREGNKKTIFANIHEICSRMKRTDEHVTSFLFAELGTSGSVDGSKRLVIKGRFQQKQIENVLRRYIVEYVTCKTCRSPNTKLEKGENRLYFVECLNCGSRRSVTAIKSGFTAQVGKRKRMQG